MATLEKIRNKAGLLVGVVGVALFAFIIGDFLNSGSTYFRQSQEKIITVNGEVINVQDYQLLVDEMTEVYKMQSGSNNIPEEVYSQVRQSVYDGLVRDIILKEEMGKLGMSVSPEELFDMVQGENISPMIQQNQMFANPQTGVFDKMALLNFLKMIDDDNIASYPADQRAQFVQARNFWLFMEKNIKRQRTEQKYVTLLTKAVAANKLDARDAFDGTAESADIVYAMQAYSSIPDSTVTVSKGEMEKLYNQRKEAFKQTESKVIKYIAVNIVPSQDDYNKAQTEMDNLKQELATTDRVAEIVNENSEIPYVDAFFAATNFDPELKQFATTASIGEVSAPAFENDKYRLFKLIDKTTAPDSAKVSHIMIAGETEARMNTLADSLLNVLNNGGDFAALAATYSVDQSNQNGGELGWFTEIAALRNLNEDFKNVVFTAPLNKVSLVKSNYGIHLVKVTERTAPVAKYKIADIDMTVTPSSATYSDIYNSLNHFVSSNNTMEKIDANAQNEGFNLLSNITITAADQTLGAIKGSRAVVRWAFQNEKGKISDIFECDNKFIVAAVQGTLPEGYRSFASVEPMLRSEVAAQKKGEQIAQGLKAKNLTSMDAYAQAMNSKLDSVKFVSFSTRRITDIGVEPKLNAMVALSQVNQVSAPVAGNNGVYVFQTYAKNQDATEYNEANQVRSMEASYMYSVGYQSIESLVNKAKIEDNRIRFY